MKCTREILADSPVIAAVTGEQGLLRALESDCQVIFLLFGSIVNVGDLVKQVHDRGKTCVVHIDLIEGFSNREVAVDGLLKLSHPDGIISTRAGMIRRAQSLGVPAIQRAFIIDSMSLKSLMSQVEINQPDFVELLPGILPSIIQEVTAKIDVPLIAGGLIRSKQDVMQALNAGVIAVSTTSEEVWKM